MTEMRFDDDHGERVGEAQLRELAAYADGTLDAARAEAVAARARSSPALARLLADQLRALDAIDAARVAAPASLRAGLPSVQRRPAIGRRPRLALPAGAAAALAALVVALMVALSGGGPGAPTVAQAAQLAARGAILPAPAKDSSDARLLSSAVDGVHHPYWEDSFGWRTTGARADAIAGRRAVTVYYSDAAHESVGYTIVAGPALAAPAGAHTFSIAGTRFESFRVATRTVLTWRRQGHTCILSGVGVAAARMLTLAAWRAHDGALAWRPPAAAV